ncbi:MAG: hypothetical protein EU529_07415 [Promethearchaeota archaeon]|nr:MAG: hypothetical protein EU529_07415 [Candidatus Lokiarchaeota archaeon]
MTQKKSDPLSHSAEEAEEWRSTRIENAPPDLYDPSKPRLGRRESEPHAAEVTYLRDVLTTNFPKGRALWDLHHYFIASKGVFKGKKIDLQLDVSFFKELTISFAIPSYDATMYEGKIPDMGINVLSKSTWREDISEIVETCKDLSIPVYAVFSPYLVTSKRYAPPFLRVYILQDDGSYKQEDLRAITIEEGGSIDEPQILDLSDKLPFRLGLMRLKQQFLGGKPLFRLILIDPLELRVLPTRREREVAEGEKKAEEAKKELQEYRDKFGELR